MKYSELSYRALQEECKENGLNAKGSRDELLERLEGTEPEAKPPVYFRFVGGKDREISVTRYNRNGQPYQEPRIEKADNPVEISLTPHNKPGAFEYRFQLNGDPVPVENVPANRRFIERLRNGSHFEEVEFEAA